ncbi:MAG TPA: TlpA disulfide reductase family protein [Cyclobacteriaceae bacterium]|nr:TlpA disulfide reductase family protein [Cyclobacteriaceae bacterium]HRK55333.1 TlpA disulfide reductase family protein [Cyclobacteriaceae bacterium]
MTRIIKFLKSWAGTVLIVATLYFTGLLSSISFLAQSAVLKTGLMNASAEMVEEDINFNYDFQIKDLNGNRLDFAQFKNKVVFLNLWATWCGPCRAEMPTIQKLYEKMEDDPNVVFVMLSIDKDKDLPKVIKYLKDKDYTFNGYMPSGYLTEQLNVRSIPTTFVISKEGKIITKEVGTTNFNTNRFYQFLKEESEK